MPEMQRLRIGGINYMLGFSLFFFVFVYILIGFGVSMCFSGIPEMINKNERVCDIAVRLLLGILKWPYTLLISRPKDWEGL